jgi:hypothetical protein
MSGARALEWLHVERLEKAMSQTPPATEDHATDPMEDVIGAVPLVLPAFGAVMIFLLAFIAVTMA